MIVINNRIQEKDIFAIHGSETGIGYVLKDYTICYAMLIIDSTTK